MTHIETEPSGEVKGRVHDEHTLYIQAASTTLGAMGIEAKIVEGGNGLDLDAHLTRQQASEVIFHGLMAVSKGLAPQRPKMATVSPLPSREDARHHVLAAA